MFALDLFIAPNINLAPDEATRILVSGSSDETLKIWDLNSWPPQKISSLEEVHDLGKKATNGICKLRNTYYKIREGFQ